MGPLGVPLGIPKVIARGLVGGRRSWDGGVCRNYYKKRMDVGASQAVRTIPKSKNEYAVFDSSQAGLELAASNIALKLFVRPRVYLC